MIAPVRVDREDARQAIEVDELQALDLAVDQEERPA